MTAAAFPKKDDRRNLIKKVTVGRDYIIEIEFNFTYDEFQKFSRSGTAEL